MRRYKNASELYDIFYKERKEDIAFYNKILKEYKNTFSNNKVIEIGAGTGRVLLPIAARNPDLEFHAVDVIGDEIEVLKEKAAREGIKNIVTHVTDINDFKPEEKFSFAFAPFRVIQHCQSLDEMDKFVGSTKDLLTDDGRFVFDLMNVTTSSKLKILKNIIPLNIVTVKKIILSGYILQVIFSKIRQL